MWHKLFSCLKDCEHSVVQLTRPVKLRRTPFRSRQSLRASIIYKGPAQFVTRQSVEALPSASDRVTSTAVTHEAVECDSAVNGALPHTDDDKEQGNTFPEQHKDLFLFSTFGISYKISTLNRWNNTGAVQYGKMHGPVQFHAWTGWWIDFERR